MASTSLRISIAGQCGSSHKEPLLAGNSRSSLTNSFRPLQPPPRPTVLCFSSRRRERDIPSVSSKIIKKKVSTEENVGEDENAADSLFRKLREVLKNVGDDISGEELEKLEQELGEALTDEELFGALESLACGVTKDEEKEEEEDEEEDDGGVDDISTVEEEIAKLVQELADVLEDDKFVEAMEYVAQEETEEEEEIGTKEDKEEEDIDNDYDVKVIEIEMDDDDNGEEEDDYNEYEVKVAEAKMDDDDDNKDEDDEEEENDDVDEDDDGDYEAKVVDVEIEEEEEEGVDDEDDINKLTELVEKLSKALEDDDILIELQ